MKYSKVYQAKDEVDASLLVGYLESNGIKAVIQSTDDIAHRISGTRVMPRDIYVPEEKLEEAIQLIQEVRS